MRILTTDPPPPELEELLERRRRTGIDKLDEAWDGVLHMSPDPSFSHAAVAQQLAELLGPLARAAGLVPLVSTFNLGEPGRNYRIPDGGVLRETPTGAWVDTAALVLEIVSPGDDSWNKFDYFAEHDVGEVLVVDPQTRAVQWFALTAGEYRPVERSTLIELGAAELTERIDWPPLAQ